MSRRAWVIVLTVAVLCILVGRKAQRPIDADSLRRRAESSLRAGDSNGAIRDFERALKIDPRDAQALGGLAQALEARGDTAGAIAAQRHAVDLARREIWPLASRVAALRNLGFALYRHGDLEPAIAALAAIDSLDAGTLETDLVLAVARLLHGERETVARALPHLQSRYGQIEPLWKLGMAASAARPPGEVTPRNALEMFVGVRAAPRDPVRLSAELGPIAKVDPVCRALLAEAWLDAGQPEDAGRIWASLEPGPLESLAAIGASQVAMDAGRPAEALEQLDPAHRDPGTPRETVLYHQARALAALGRVDEARAALDWALESNPLSTRSERLRDEIAGR